jgi:hypothetical protein
MSKNLEEFGKSLRRIWYEFVKNLLKAAMDGNALRGLEILQILLEILLLKKWVIGVPDDRILGVEELALVFVERSTQSKSLHKIRICQKQSAELHPIRFARANSFVSIRHGEAPTH